ncbi:MAG: DUF4225 domain-containing protein [Chitinophagales bacterium]|nr:DUF4225 domain-containing protein [Chitinophagales bacterium]
MTKKRIISKQNPYLSYMYLSYTGMTIDSLDISDSVSLRFTAVESSIPILIIGESKLSPNHYFIDDFELREGWIKQMVCPDGAQYAEGGGYRYAWNGAENIDEIYGRFGTYDLGARMYNPKIGRMFSPDPRESEYVWQSTYAYYANSPISEIDENGEGGESSSEDNNSNSSLVNRFTGGLKAASGTLQMVGGVGLLLTPEPTMLTKVGGAIALSHGADDFQSGIRQLFTGKSTESFTYQGLSSTAKVMGASDNTANAIATTGDIGLGFFGGAGAYRVATAPSKIVGTAQQTGTAGHATTSYYWAFRYALNPKVEKVTLDLGYKKLGAVGRVPYKYGPRPDVGVLYKGGAVKAIEVQSKTDIPARLIYRNANFQNLKGITGSVDVKDPLKIFQILNLK